MHSSRYHVELLLCLFGTCLAMARLTEADMSDPLSSKVLSQSERQVTPQDPTACATGATFFGPPPPSDRTMVRISGANLKQQLLPADIETIGIDDAGHKTEAKQATTIKSSSGIQAEAVIKHGANFSETQIRVKCSSGAFSTWLKVAK
jgi:hypothetical protein